MTTETVKIPTKEEILAPEPSEPTTTTENEPSEAEQRAMDDGWVPKDQWKGPEDEWRPAKEFNDRGELFSRIKSQTKELAEIKRAMEFLTKQHKDQYQAGVKDTIEKLKNARNAALEDGDHVAAEQIRDKIEEVKDQAAEAAKIQVTKQPAGPTQTFLNWKEKNSWYMKDEDLTDLADTKGQSFRRKNPDASEAEMLAYVTEAVRGVYPDKFPKRSPPSPSGNGRESPRGRTNDNLSSKLKEAEEGMDEDSLKIMKTIIKQTGMTKEEYLKSYTS